MPLYSLVLFAIAPAAFAKKVRVRPPVVVHRLLEEIVKNIELSYYMPNIELYSISRKQFMDECVEYSQVVIFNGRYENVKSLISEFPDKKFIFNGRGINPFFINFIGKLNCSLNKFIVCVIIHKSPTNKNIC